MGGKYFGVCLFLAIAVVGLRAEQLQKVSPDNVGFTIQPFINGDPSGPPTLDHPSLRGPLLDPTVPAAVSAVPEPTTIAMLFLGSGCAGAFAAFRRRRRG